MLGPPRGFVGFARDTATDDAAERVRLYADALGRVPSPLGEAGYVWAVRGTSIALLVGHGLAVVVVRRRPMPRAVWLGVPVAAQLVALAYPPTSADVFYYAFAAHAANDLGANPYVLAPDAFPADPLLRFNFWTFITSPYGPLWTTFSRIVETFVGSDPLRVSLAFKLLAALAGLAAAAIVARLAEVLRRGSGVVAFVVVAWHPLFIIETGGTAHQDAAMMLLALLGLMLLTRGVGSVRLGVVLVAASALVKYATLPLLALAALDRLRERPWQRIAARSAGDVGAVLALTLLVAAPYWADGAMLDSVLAEPARLFANPLFALPNDVIEARSGDSVARSYREVTRLTTQIVVLAVSVAAIVWCARRVWRERPAGAALLRIQLHGWVAVTVVLSLLPVNAHAWYTIWALGPVAALSGGRGRWLAAYLVLVGCFFVAYHTEVAR